MADEAGTEAARVRPAPLYRLRDGNLHTWSCLQLVTLFKSKFVEPKLMTKCKFYPCYETVFNFKFASPPELFLKRPCGPQATKKSGIKAISTYYF